MSAILKDDTYKVIDAIKEATGRGLERSGLAGTSVRSVNAMIFAARIGGSRWDDF